MRKKTLVDEEEGEIENQNDKYRLTRYEQETHIYYNAEEGFAEVESAMPTVIKKLEKLNKRFPDVYKLAHEDNNWHTVSYRVPKKYIRFGMPRSNQKTMSAEHKEKIVKALQKYREDKKNNE